MSRARDILRDTGSSWRCIQLSEELAQMKYQVWRKARDLQHSKWIVLRNLLNKILRTIEYEMPREVKAYVVITQS